MTAVHRISDDQFAVRKGRGYVVVRWNERSGQYRVPTTDYLVYVTPSRDGAIAYAANWGAVRRLDDGTPARLRDLKEGLA